jgi:hypothetical protein
MAAQASSAPNTKKWWLTLHKILAPVPDRFINVKQFDPQAVGARAALLIISSHTDLPSYTEEDLLKLIYETTSRATERAYKLYNIISKKENLINQQYDIWHIDRQA